jgi:chromosomal replication initiator protein
VPHVSDQLTPRDTGPVGINETATHQDLGSIWQAVTERLRTAVPETTFRLWLEPLRAVAAQGDTLYVNAPEGIRTWVERRYAPLIGQSLSQVATGLREVSFATPETAAATVAGPSVTEAAVNPTYTFERFVIGEGNRLAHAAALAVAEAPAEAYNPLFIHGPPGLGKTHLLTAIANYLHSSVPALHVRFTTAECFTNEFVAALRSSGAEEFKRRYRDIDVLLIDDVQFLEGKPHTEEEFFHTFNALYESGSQLVLSADRIPSELSTLATQLRDRFEWGLTVAVEAPNLATRIIVLRRLVREADIEITDGDALSVLARRIDANVRQLHGALTRVIAQASLRAEPLSAELVDRVIPPGPTKSVDNVREIQDAVAAYFGIPHESLTGPGRAAKPLRARQLAIYLCRELTELSLPQIGRAFGGRDHATILNAIRRIDQQRNAGNHEVCAQLDHLRSVIQSDQSIAA